MLGVVGVDLLGELVDAGDGEFALLGGVVVGLGLDPLRVGVDGDRLDVAGLEVGREAGRRTGVEVVLVAAVAVAQERLHDDRQDDDDQYGKDGAADELVQPELPFGEEASRPSRHFMVAYPPDARYTPPAAAGRRLAGARPTDRRDTKRARARRGYPPVSSETASARSPAT